MHNNPQRTRWEKGSDTSDILIILAGFCACLFLKALGKTTKTNGCHIEPERVAANTQTMKRTSNSQKNSSDTTYSNYFYSWEQLPEFVLLGR